MVHMHHLLQRNYSQCRLFGFRADPPTTTSQRLKSITTGTLPTFVDIGERGDVSIVMVLMMMMMIVMKMKMMMMMIVMMILMMISDGDDDKMDDADEEDVIIIIMSSIMSIGRQ